MKYLMDHSRTHRSEAGFALIEAIVAAAVLAIVALAVLSGIDAASNTSAREKARAVAASLAEQDQERLRAMPYEQVLKPGGVAQQPDVSVDGVTYKIKSEADLVTDDIAGTPECGNEGTEVAYAHITSTVTSAIVGRRIVPVMVDSLVPPTQEYAEGHGTLGVKVVDRSATRGVPSVSVSAVSTAYSPPVASTDVNGCVVFTDIPIGTYTVTLNKAGYIDRDGDQSSQVTANVVAKKVVFATPSYDLADTIGASVMTHAPNKTWATAGTLYQKPSKARKVSTTNGANVGLFTTVTPPAPATSVSVGGLFPFAENSYSFFTGGCKYMAPDKVATTTNSNPLWPNYFSTTGGINPAAAVLADPAVATQTATVRQPPFSIRINKNRAGSTTWTDGTSSFVVWAILRKPAGYSTDACAEARYELTTTTWDTSLFGTQASPTHWVSQTGATFDPGMPFGTYEICLRNGSDGAVAVANYNNTSPDGMSAVTSIDANTLYWQSSESCT